MKQALLQNLNVTFVALYITIKGRNMIAICIFHKYRNKTSYKINIFLYGRNMIAIWIFHIWIFHKSRNNITTKLIFFCMVGI